MFGDRLPHRLCVSSVGERLKRDGDGHSCDGVRRGHVAIFSVAHWQKPPRLELKKKKKKDRKITLAM